MFTIPLSSYISNTKVDFVDQIPGLPATVGYWACQEGTGTDVADKSVTQANGVFSGSPQSMTWGTGNWGNCVVSPNWAGNQHVYCNLTSKGLISNTLTVSFWTNTATYTQFCDWIEIGDVNMQLSVFENCGAGTVEALFGANSINNADTRYCTWNNSFTGSVDFSNNWTHVAYTLDTPNNIARLYINGVANGTLAGGWKNTSATYALTKFSFGGGHDRISRGTNCFMQEVRLYNTVLNADSIGILYNYVPKAA